MNRDDPIFELLAVLAKGLEHADKLELPMVAVKLCEAMMWLREEMGALNSDLN